jgi:glycosyltransferase involved in cell wall biosynthesis
VSVSRYQDEPGCCDTVEEPQVSVVMPAYNAAASLGTAVASILRQSLTSLEVVIVDDGSTDATFAVARALAAEDPRVKVFRCPCNRGQAAARNLGLTRARGRWIALVDADDEIAEDRLNLLSEAGEATGADLIADGVVFAGPRQPGTPARLPACEGLNGETTTLSLEALIRSDIPLNGLCSFGYLKPLMRRAFLEHWRLCYDEDLRFAEDFNLYVRALMCGGRFVLHPRTLYVYNQTPVSVSRNLHVLPKSADDALVNSRRIRELARQFRIAGLDRLLDEHEQRWSTVLWFNRLKLALRAGRISDVLQLTLDCPSGPRGVLRFARDRVRVKRGQEHMYDT